jgi:predicted TPR repeat methyltransferase
MCLPHRQLRKRKSRQKRQELILVENMQISDAISLLNNGEFAAAQSICEKLTALDPKNAQAWNLLGLADAQQGNLEKSVESFRSATALASTNPNYHFNLALAYNALGQLEQTEASYREAIQQNEDFREAYINLGSLLVEASRPEEAVTVLKSLIERCEDASDAHYNLANLFRITDNAKDAIAHYRRAIELSPDFANARENLARVLESQGQTQDAQQVIQDWLEYEPDSSMAKHMLASLNGENVPERCDDEYIRETFDENFAGKFDEQLSRLQYKAPELVANALLSFSETKDALAILDAGCGTGLCAEKLRPAATTLDGVDLSAAMLEVAKSRNLYDNLVEGELTEYLRSHEREYDCIISADTLCYFGDLSQVFLAAANCLKGQGLFVFTVELLEEEVKVSYFLQTNGRYRHSERYVQNSLSNAGLRVQSLESATLRTERGEPVLGAVVVAELVA